MGKKSGCELSSVCLSVLVIHQSEGSCGLYDLTYGPTSIKHALAQLNCYDCVMCSFGVFGLSVSGWRCPVSCALRRDTGGERDHPPLHSQLYDVCLNCCSHAELQVTGDGCKFDCKLHQHTFLFLCS